MEVQLLREQSADAQKCLGDGGLLTQLPLGPPLLCHVPEDQHHANQPAR
jgi:hypothetical protein